MLTFVAKNIATNLDLRSWTFPGWLPYTGTAALMTGGFEAKSREELKSAFLYPGGCSVPSFEQGIVGHVTFVTQDLTPSIATCGGQLDGGGFKKDCVLLQGNRWQGGILEDLPDVRDRAGSVVIKSGVYILGGRSTHETSIFLRANSRSWETGPRLPSPTGPSNPDMIWHDIPCAAQISSDSFLLQYETNVYEFNARVSGPTNNAGWAPKAKWPQLKKTNGAAAGCGVVNNIFVVASAYGTEIINLSTRILTQGGDLAKARRYHKILSINGRLYALGGWNWSSELGHHFFADVEEFVEETGTWKPSPALPGRRADGGGVAVDLALVCG